MGRRSLADGLLVSNTPLGEFDCKTSPMLSTTVLLAVFLAAIVLSRPAKLGDDEYFVLGDFSPQAKDSRLWREGAPGHTPYAVPASHIRGVVTHIYWPPKRWRILR